MKVFLSAAVRKLTLGALCHVTVRDGLFGALVASVLLWGFSGGWLEVGRLFGPLPFGLGLTGSFVPFSVGLETGCLFGYLA